MPGTNRLIRITSICGAADPARLSLLKHKPIWIVHGSEDTVVLPDRDRSAAKALTDALLPLIYDELRKLVAAHPSREATGQTLLRSSDLSQIGNQHPGIQSGNPISTIRLSDCRSKLIV